MAKTYFISLSSFQKLHTKNVYDLSNHWTEEMTKSGQEDIYPQRNQGVRKSIMSKAGMKGKGKDDKTRKEQIHEGRKENNLR